MLLIFSFQTTFLSKGIVSESPNSYPFDLANFAILLTLSTKVDIVLPCVVNVCEGVGPVYSSPVLLTIVAVLPGTLLSNSAKTQASAGVHNLVSAKLNLAKVLLVVFSYFVVYVAPKPVHSFKFLNTVAAGISFAVK